MLARLAADVIHASPLANEWIEPPPVVVERVVEYSFIELARHRARLRSALFAIPEVVSLAVDEELNRVVIGLEDLAAEAAVLALVAELAVPAEVVSFSQGSRIRMPGADSGRWSPHPSPSGGSAGVWLTGPTADGKLRAGYQVQADGGSACALGFTAVLEDGSLVFVSNSHCSKTPWITDSGDWGQPDTSNLVGLEIYDPRPWRCGGNFCRHSDASLMEVNTDVSIALGEIGRTVRRDRNCRIGSLNTDVEWCTRSVDPENPTIRITSVRTGSTKKDILDKIGPITGWTWGLVTETCEDRRGETGVVIKCGDQVDFVTGKGDSGAPVFQYRYGSAEFRGIVYGYEDLRQDGAGRKGWFQDLEQIEWDLGTLTVMDPGSPRVEVLGRNLVPREEECTWTAYMRRGLEPLSYGWSGILHGSGPSITGVVEESGWLKVTVTDPLDRTDRDSLEVRVGGGPRCRRDDDDGPGGDTLRLPPPPSGP